MLFANDFASRTELGKYGSNAIGLYAFDLRFQPEDLEAVAANAMTDGSDDKKMDLLHVDRDGGYLVVAQVYYRAAPNVADVAPSKKASDLNTAVSWLLNQPIEEVPERLKHRVEAVRDAIRDNQIRSVFIWYVHNLLPSKNVADELRAVEQSAVSAIRTNFPDSQVPEISAEEISSSTLEEWYKASTTPIFVTDSLNLQTNGGYLQKEGDWEAFATAVPAGWLYDLYKKYGSTLFSANLRGYLGSRKSDSNINNGIQNTAASDPSHFWVYNNGITALVNELKISGSQKQTDLEMKGISIVNGAQTTGAIAALKDKPNQTAMVPARFIMCNDTRTIRSIIKYNNSQNKLEAPDFRSNDQIQKRLRDQFSLIPKSHYTGGRRGDTADDKRRHPDLIPAETAGQALAAFHGQPSIAYNDKSDIWISNKYYSSFFPERITAKHLVFAYSLYRTVERIKVELFQIGKPTSEQANQIEFFDGRGASFLLCSSMASCIETILKQRIADRFALSFGERVSPDDAGALWRPVVQILLPFYGKLQPAISARLAEPAVKAAEKDFLSNLVSFQAILGQELDAKLSKFRDAVVVD